MEYTSKKSSVDHIQERLFSNHRRELAAEFVDSEERIC